MDSLTQITLGAAVGEVVLGPKIGNRAMVWGAIAGTIPDMDVLAKLVSDELGAFAFHRAITHSFTFALLAPIPLAWLAQKLYKDVEVKEFARQMGITAGLIFLILFLGSLGMPLGKVELLQISLVVASSIVAFFLVIYGWRRFRKKEDQFPDLGWKPWAWLFFWAIITHPLLDACTTFGTQLFQPISGYRVAFSTISVIDPIYTVPFLICLLIASWLTRNSSSRKWLNYLGILLSSAYLIFTFFNKAHVNKVLHQSLAAKSLTYEKTATNPTILNNILWQGLAQNDTIYYYGLYSLWDKEKSFKPLQPLPKNEHLIKAYEEERAIKILKWGSKGFYNVVELPDGTLQFNNLLFGAIVDEIKSPNDYIFKIQLVEENGELKAIQSRAMEGDFSDTWNQFWKRVRGI